MSLEPKKNKIIESKFAKQTNVIAKLIETKNNENQKLTELNDLLLSKLATVK